jgi:DNA uptake protein ComE-like DNA-binding protein
MTDDTADTSGITKLSIYSCLLAVCVGVVCAAAFALAVPAPETKSVLPESVININTEPASSIERLPRVGAKLAGEIVKYRDARRRTTGEKEVFKNMADLDNVKGIGIKTLDRLRPYIKFE